MLLLLPYSSCSAPVVTIAQLTGANAALVTMNPPPGLPYNQPDSYTVSLCPTSGTCTLKTWPTNVVPFDSLAAGETYTVTATATYGTSTTSSSNQLRLVTPTSGAPALTFADDYNSSTAGGWAVRAVVAWPYDQVRGWPQGGIWRSCQSQPSLPTFCPLLHETQFDFTAVPLNDVGGGHDVTVVTRAGYATFTGLDPATHVSSL